MAKFSISFVNYDCKQSKQNLQFIRAHTCYNRIDLPDYQTYEELQAAVEFVVNNEIMGFGIE